MVCAMPADPGELSRLDLSRLTNQLAALERRVARSGHESISHPAGGHDDVANVAMGALLLVTSGPQPMKFSRAGLAMI